jgi:hypothetical protein
MSPNNNPTAEQILERVAERGRSTLDTAISLAAFAVAFVEECDAETRASLAWYLRRYADALDGSESGGVSH